MKPPSPIAAVDSGPLWPLVLILAEIAQRIESPQGIGPEPDKQDDADERTAVTERRVN